MGFFDSLASSFEKQARQNERNARITYGSKLQSAYEKTDDPAKKSAIAKEWKENRARLHDL